MRKFIFYFAVTGWILGLIAHLLSLAGYDVADKIPFIWVLHLGIFVVWIPAIIVLRNNEDLVNYQQSGTLNSMNPFGFFKAMFKNTPKWLTVIAIGGFYYAILNFVLFILSQDGVPAIQEGQYVLHEHGDIIKTLTEQEYHRYRANVLRGFSGHWLAFYGMAVGVLFPFRKRDESENGI